MITLTKEEALAVRFLIDWTVGTKSHPADWMNQHIAGTAEMERGGEIEKGALESAKQLQQTLRDLLAKL